MARVLVVDDDPGILSAVRAVLMRDGHTIQVAMDGEDALRMGRQTDLDLIILDVGLPRMDGLEVCRGIRQGSAVPILMLTGRSDEIDKVVGLEIGADDYLTKPFSPRELTARIKALLRRASGFDGLGGGTTVLTAGPVIVDLVPRRVSCNGRPVNLSPREFELLACLMSAPGRTFSSEQLLRQVWGYTDSEGSRTVTVHVAELRRKLGAAHCGDGLIETVRGRGYRFRVP